MRKDYKEPEQFVGMRDGEDVTFKTQEEDRGERSEPRARLATWTSVAMPPSLEVTE